jgi:hypothetical protein
MSHNLTGKSVITQTSFGGLVTFADPDSLPQGASPLCHDVDFSIGGFESRLGTESQYSFADLTQTNPGGLGTSVNWANPQNAVSTTLFATGLGPFLGPLDITEFAFATSDPVVGIVVMFVGAGGFSPTFTAQLIQDGAAIGIVKPAIPGAISLGGPTDLWGANPNVNATTFGVRIIASSPSPISRFQVNSVAIKLYLAQSSSNFQYIKSFPQSNGDLSTLALDASGEMWVEDVINNPKVLNPLFSGVPSGSYAKSTTADDREYIAFSDLHTGAYIPTQYNGQWFDRITQVGPGAPPQFNPQTFTGDTFAISTITQPAQQVDAFSYFLQSVGPGVTTAGNVATIYYSDSTVGVEDPDLRAAWNSGFGVNLFLTFTGSGIPTQGPYVVQVTSLGLASPPGQPRKFYYFTYILPTVAAQYFQGSGHSTYTVTYQRSLATLITAVPVPGLVPGNQITVSGSSVAGYNNTWTITQNLNSGSVGITQTQITGGVATYSYALQAGIAPAAGEQITITDTTNADGVLNGTNLVIVTASGGSTGTFTINISAPDAIAAAESGLGVTAGTKFAFDPGTALIGSSTSPILGNATGGSLIFNGSGQFIAPGIRQGVVFFGTRNFAETQPSTPIIFTIPTNTATLIASQIPLGPPDTIYRQVSITEAGQLGQPGANFYTIDDPVTYTVNGLNYISTSFRINDNTTTSIALTFRDSDLLSARPIDQPGEDLFNQIEIGNPAWIVQYAGRMFYGLAQQKVQNFINLSFDGGFNPSTVLQPLGWTIVGVGGQLIPSPVFGDAYYIHNTTGTEQATLGLITQSAYRDFYGVAILSPNTAYSVRVTARIPSGNKEGNLVISLTNSTQTLGAFTVPFSSLSETYKTVSGALLVSTATIPAGLLINIQATVIANGADVEIDRIEPFPTLTPILTTRLLASYAFDPEGVDGESGAIETNSENTQPCYGAVVMYDLLYLLKDRSMYYTQDSSGDEPDDWGIHEVSNKAGACGINAYDSGEEWIVTANRNGVYVFTGGEPQKISQEIQQVWDTINWGAGQSIWLRNDVQERKIYIGVPLPTPNQWLPDASPTSGLVTIVSIQGSQAEHAVLSRIQVTFKQTPPPMTVDQTYVFSGLTTYTNLNGKTLTPISVFGNQVSFNLIEGGTFGPFSDTGQAVITPGIPGSQSVILMCSYEAQSSGSSVIDADPLAATFYGDLLAEDMKRKWSIWQIPSPYADFITQQNGEDQPLLIGNGVSNSKIYALAGTNDDGAEIPWRYVTSGFGSDGDVKKMPALGSGLKRWSLWKSRMVGSGSVILKMILETLTPQPTPTNAKGAALATRQNTYTIQLDQRADLRGSACNARGNIVYVSMESEGVDSTIQVSQFTMGGTKDTYNADYVRD